MVISDLEILVQDRLEETRGTPGTFWDVQNEIRPFLAEAMSEAALLIGYPQARSSEAFQIPAGVNLVALPSYVAALLRIEATTSIVQKYSLTDLDNENAQWELDTGDNPLYWIPWGLTQVIIYPKLNAPVNTVLSFIQDPISSARPYSGTEPVLFNREYSDAFVEYAAHVARLKEGGADFVQSSRSYDDFLRLMGEYSEHISTTDMLRFTKVMGSPAKAGERK